MFLDIGETFMLDDKKFIVKLEDRPCGGCDIIGDCAYLSYRELIPECVARKREDKNAVVFVEVKECE